MAKSPLAEFNCSSSSIVAPTVDDVSFRRAMRALAGAVCVVATGSPGQRSGFTATAVCSLTAAPPRLLVCINKAVSAYGQIDVSGELSINALSWNQTGLAKRFAGMLPEVRGDARFDEGEWTQVHGVPALTNGCVFFICRVAERIGQSTHTIFICDVLGAQLGTSTAPKAHEGLIYTDGHFRHLAPMAGTENALVEWIW